MKKIKTFLFLLKQLFVRESREVSDLQNIPGNKHDFTDDLEQLIDMRDMKVAEIMIPRADLIAISVNSTLEEIKAKFIETKFLRLILYGKDLDDIVGFINLRDFFIFIADNNKDFSVETIMKKTIYAARSTKCFALLDKMKQGDFEIAVILDEYGGIEGIISIEKLLESMVTKTEESDEEESQSGLLIQKIHDNIYILDARTSIQKVEELFDDAGFLSEEEGEYETIGGFILSYLDKVPAKGEKFEHVGGLQVEIVDSTNRAIKKVKITRVEKIN